VGLFTFRLRDRFDNQETFSERTRAPYGSLYLQHTLRPTPQWRLQGGFRANYFGEGNYLRLEPRLSLEHRPADNLRLQLGYGRYYQFLTLITNEAFSGFDVWLTTGSGVQPAFGDQFVAGVKNTLREGLNLDIEVYYRTMNRLFELDPFVGDAAGLDYEELFHFGKGYAYGTEVLLEKTRGRLNGFIGYTLGVTRRRFPQLNDYEYYPPKYDRLHDANLVVNYDGVRFWRICKAERPCRVTSVFTYGTGQAYTNPDRSFKLVDNPFGNTVLDVTVGPFNAARLPAYHRLDVGISKLGRFFGFADYELQLQVINVYARKNLWSVFIEFEEDNTVKRTEIPQIPVPIPNIAFTLRF
jgi:hypothetical protein